MKSGHVKRVYSVRFVSSLWNKIEMKSFCGEKKAFVIFCWITGKKPKTKFHIRKLEETLSIQ